MLNINSPQELEDAFNGLLTQVNELHAEAILNKVLVPHLIGLLVRKAQDPATYFEGLRSSSRQNLAASRFEGGDPEANAAVKRMAMDRHEQVFEEMSRTLGLSSHTRQ